jgi:endonuclease-3
MRIVPRREWTDWTHLLIAHGRAVCTARVPHCDACVLVDLCPTGAANRRGSVRRPRVTPR